jgi:pre-mRNA-splicing helicase BRR2
LVLEADRETRRKHDEATGEVESLVGKMGQRRMGDKVKFSRPPELAERMERKK